METANDARQGESHTDAQVANPTAQKKAGKNPAHPIPTRFSQDRKPHTECDLVFRRPHACHLSPIQIRNAIRP